MVCGNVDKFVPVFSNSLILLELNSITEEQCFVNKFFKISG